MAVGLCWLPLRHPHARPSSSTLPGHDTPNPSTHSQQPDPGCVDHPVAPHCHPNTMVQTGGKTPRSQVPSGPAAIDTITPTAPNAVTTPPPARGLGGHPWSYNASSLVFFFGRVQNNKFAPLQGTNTKVQHRPTCHVVTTTVTLAPPKRTHVGPATILWTPDSPPPIEDGSSHSPHAVPVQSPPSPPGAASREVSSGTQRSCCGRVC